MVKEFILNDPNVQRLEDLAKSEVQIQKSGEKLIVSGVPDNEDQSNIKYVLKSEMGVFYVLHNNKVDEVKHQLRLYIGEHLNLKEVEITNQSTYRDGGSMKLTYNVLENEGVLFIDNCISGGKGSTDSFRGEITDLKKVYESKPEKNVTRGRDTR
ncbi:hypothetical protein ACFL1H_05730 [Nanoarchaeota archaeon]